MPAAAVVAAAVLTAVVVVRAVVGATAVAAVKAAVAVEDLTVGVSPVHFEHLSFPSVVTVVAVVIAAAATVVVGSVVVVTAVVFEPDLAYAGAYAEQHHKHSRYLVAVQELGLYKGQQASVTVLSSNQPVKVGSHICLSFCTENKGSSYHHRKETVGLPSHIEDSLKTKYLI